MKTQHIIKRKEQEMKSTRTSKKTPPFEGIGKGITGLSDGF